jgi:DNA-binding CsgD family transcriptional regulator
MAGQNTTLPLTARQLQLLTALTTGKTNGEIARDFYLTENTVKTHMRRLLKALRAHDRAHAVAIGYQRGLLHLPNHRAQTARRELAARHTWSCALLSPPACDCPAGFGTPRSETRPLKRSHRVAALRANLAHGEANEQRLSRLPEWARLYIAELEAMVLRADRRRRS